MQVQVQGQMQVQVQVQVQVQGHALTALEVAQVKGQVQVQGQMQEQVQGQVQGQNLGPSAVGPMHVPPGHQLQPWSERLCVPQHF